MSVIPEYHGKRVYQNYRKEEHKRDWDVIIIGSGIGGMACAAALSKTGKKVLLLEQHYIPGGYTHSFARKGYQWDAGVHAVGEMGEKDIPGKILRWLSNDGIEMISLGNPYDQFSFPEGYTFDFPDNHKAFKKALTDQFPEQAEKIGIYFKYIDRVARKAPLFFALKMLPKGIACPANAFVNLFGRNWWKSTTTEILNEIGIEGKLRTLLTVHWGYIGSIPDESSFALHALTHTHFWNGAFYPKGGSKEFAARFLSNLAGNDGLVLTSAPVDSVIVENNRAKGVKMKDGSVFHAPIVISAAGAKNTLNSLLPEEYKNTGWARSVLKLDDSPPYLCLNLGFRGDIRKSGASSSNLWLYDTWNNNISYWDIADKNSQPHILYLSFPSLKDPLHEPGPRHMHTGECVTFINWESVAKWADSSKSERPEDYLRFKEELTGRLLSVLKKRIPHIMQHMDFCELSTPLTSYFYTRATRGAIYGLAATPERFLNNDLRTTTPIKNFYLTGIDIASIGVVGGMVSGLLTAATIDRRLCRHFF